MGKYLDSGGLSHLMTKIKAAIAATVTGVKGNSESSYRTGNVNITPANIGAVAATGNETVYGNKYFAGTTTLDPNSVVYVSRNTKVGASSIGLWQSPIPKYLWHDLFSFCRYDVPTYYTSTDNSTWTQGTTDKRHFAQLENLSIPALTSTITGVRFVWNSASFYYCGATWLVLGTSYSYPVAHYTVKFEGSENGTDWTEILLSENLTVNSAPVWLSLTGVGTSQHLRLTITKAADDTGILNLNAIKMLTSRWGGQGAGSELEYPYVWDATPNITPIEDVTSNLGASSKRWSNVYSADFRGNRFFGGLTSPSMRVTSANTTGYAGLLKYILATSAMTTGKPTSGDGHILDMEWDNNGKWHGQVAVPTGSAGHMEWRTENGGTWTEWRSLLDARDLSSATNSSSEDLAATPKAVKAAYDLADGAADTAGRALSAATGAKAVKVAYSISNGTVTGEVHVYSAGSEVTEQWPANAYSWSYEVGAGNWVSLGTGYTKNVALSTLGYGGNLKCSFNDEVTS